MPLSFLKTRKLRPYELLVIAVLITFMLVFLVYRPIQLDYFSPHKSFNHKVVIDAAHGGADSGAVYCEKYYTKSGMVDCASPILLTEKEVLLTIATDAEEILAKRGYGVSLTRHSDIPLSIEERVKITNDSGADLFVSLHINSPLKIPCPEEGSETWYDPNFPESRKFAGIVQGNIAKSLNAKDNGISAVNSNYFQGITIPSVKIVLGNMCNPSEYRKFSDKTTRYAIATAIAESIDEFFKISAQSAANIANDKNI